MFMFVPDRGAKTLPAIGDVVLKIDKAAMMMTVRIMEAWTKRDEI